MKAPSLGNLRRVARQLGQGMTELIIILMVVGIGAIFVYTQFGDVLRNQTAAGGTPGGGGGAPGGGGGAPGGGGEGAFEPPSPTPPEENPDEEIGDTGEEAAPLETADIGASPICTEWLCGRCIQLGIAPPDNVPRWHCD
jgi:hypothetical protein